MHDDISPMTPAPIDDHEGAMARSELYRAAKYSMKLFQMIQDGQDLEGWVQAKITKSADYLDSVYHYMEYQVKFGDGSHASNIDDITGDAEDELPSDEPVSDMDDEEKDIQEMTTYEQKLKALLEGAVKEASGVRAGDKKKGKVEKSERKIYFAKLEKDNKVKGVTTQAEEGESQGEVRDRIRRENHGWTVASIREKDSIDEAAEKIAKAEKAAKEEKAAKAKKDKMVKEAMTIVVEKAVSKAQQKFMGMVHAAQKGEKAASPEVAKVAKGMKKKDAEDFASTKHKGLPEKKKKTDETFMPVKKEQPKSPMDKVVGGIKNIANKVTGNTPTPKTKNTKKDMNQPEEYDESMSPPDGATAAPKKDPKTGKYPVITSGPNKGKEWSQEKPGPTNPNFKEDQDLVKSIVKKVVAEKKSGGKKPDANKDGIPDYAQDGKGANDLGKGKGGAPKKGVNPFAKKDEKKESVKESADLARMKQFLTRLNG